MNRHHHKMFFSSKRSCPPGIVLLLAVNAGDVAQTSAVLARGVDPDSATDARGRTALHLAAIHGHAGVARALLDAGASTECLTPGDDFTPLRLAAEKGHVSVARVLLEFGARVSARDSIDRATPLHAAAEAGHVAMIVELASRGAALEARATSGQTPLRWALSLGRVRAVETLLEFGADPNAPDRLGASCLHGIAAMGSDSASAASPRTMTNPTSGSQTEAAAVARTGTGTGTRTAMSAVGSPGGLAELLLAYGALPNFVRPPRLPCSASSIDSFVQQTVRASQSQSHAGCRCRRAGSPGRVGGVDSTLLHGKFVGETPLHVAARESSTMVVEALLRAGADPNVKNSEEEGGMSPLHCAAAPGGEGRGAVARLLLEAGADPEALAADGVTTPLRLACLNSAVACVEALLRWEPRAITHVSRNLRYPLNVLPVNAGSDAPSNLSDARTLEGTSSVSPGPVAPLDNSFLPASSTSSSSLVDASPMSDDGVGSLARSGEDSVGARWGPGDASAAGDHGSDGDAVRLAPSVSPPIARYVPARAVSSPWPSLSPLEELVGSRVPSAARDPADDEKIRGMIKRAPADRAWRRRGWLIMLYHRHGMGISSGASERAAPRLYSAAGKGRRAGAVETVHESRGCQVKIPGSLCKAGRDQGDVQLGVLSGVSNRNLDESEDGRRRRRGSDRCPVFVAGGSCLPRPTWAVQCPGSAECRDWKDARARCFRSIPTCSSGTAGIQSAPSDEASSPCLRKRARPAWGGGGDEGDDAFELLGTSSSENVDWGLGKVCRGLKRYRVDSGAPLSGVRSVRVRRTETAGVTGWQRVGAEEDGGVIPGTDGEVSSVVGVNGCGLSSVVRRLFEIQGDESVLRRVVACL